MPAAKGAPFRNGKPVGVALDMELLRGEKIGDRLDEGFEKF
jgi:hypothetical protein